MVDQKENIEQISEWKKAESAFKTYKDYLSNIINTIGDPIFVKDDNFRFVLANDALCKMLGMEREKIIGKTLGESLPKDQMDHFLEVDKKVLESGQENTCEEPLTGRDKKILTIVTKKTRYVDDKGSKFLVGVIRDITERKQAEEKLRIKDWAIESSANAIVNSDIEGNLTYMNPAFLKLWGYSSPAEALGKTAVGFWQMGEKAAEAMEAVRKKGGWSGELVARRKDGTLFNVYVTSSMIVNDAGKPVCMQASFLDITDRRKAEEQIRESEEKYRILFETMIQGIVYQDADGKIISANPAAESILGLTLDQMQGRTSIDPRWKAIHEDGSDFLGETHPSMAALKTGSKVLNTVMGVLNPKDDSYRWININAVPLFKPGENKPNKVYTTFEDVTDRKKTKDKLRETNEYLDNLFNYANAPIIIWDTQYKITRFNRAFESLTGRAAKDVIGKSFEILFPPKEISASMELIRKTTTGEWWNVVEMPILNVNGSVKTVLWNSAVIFSPDGKTPIAAIAQGQDITERKKAEIELKYSEERLKIIFESAPDAYYLNDLKGTFLDGNKAAEKVTGYKRDELIGKSFLTLKLLSPAQIPKAAALLARNLIGLPTGPDEFILNKKDGTKVAVEISTRPVKIKGQTMVLGLARDLSERKKAEISLRESEEKFKAIFDKANDGFILASMKDKKFILGNNAICEMTGYTAEEIKTLGVMDLHPEKDLPYVIGQFEKQARGEIKTAENIPVKRKDGSIFYVEINSSLVTVQGEACLMGVFRDVTERKSAEAAREELLHKVEEANRNKTQFISDVSHELRTPLASIKGFVSTIRSDPAMDEPTRQDFLRITEEETDRLTRIIEDLLDISRIESGRLKLSMRSFNITDLIMKNIENLKPQAESKGIVIQSQPAPTPYIVYADQDKTSQIMINLLSNAIKYNKAGGKVKVAASEDDGKIRVDIEDTGIGISEKDIPHMFEKFFRAEGASRETPGTGLGLAVTKSLVEVMGGMIEMQSKLGEGSRFSFSLPKQAGDQKEKTNEFS